MLVTLTLSALTSLVLAAPLLLAVGHRVRWTSRAFSVPVVAAWSVMASEVARVLFELPSRYVLVAALTLLAVSLLVVWARPLWNAVGHIFFSALVAACLAYLALAANATLAGGLSTVATVASVLLLILEVFAVTVSITFAFESIDVACRRRWKRAEPFRDESYLPFVSLHVPAYNEPPDMLIETIRSLEAIDYPNFEIIVIDNNTEDEAVWRPVERYCDGRPRVTFVHVNPLPGYKSGALNLVLREHTSPEAELIGVVDADYIVRPEYLRSLVGYFADPDMAFVQTPQDYREYEGDTYLTACYDAYRYFFETAMPSRNDRNSIIFGGTMGLLRRSVLDDLDGWDEWCITEDAESSLRMLRAGYSGHYVNETFGHGIMPLTFTSLKKQRFRWCFGGVQILRKHWRSLMPWDRHPTNRLSIAQRLDYLFGGLQWFGDLAGLAFTSLLVVSAGLLVTTGAVGLRALTGALVLVPLVLIGSGLLRALWALRVLTGIGLRRGLLAFATWLSLSWTTALACMRGVVRRDGVFLRTPKWQAGRHLIEALRESRIETAFGASLAAIAGIVAVHGGHWPLAVLAAWQATVFTASPFMAWLNQRTELSARLARRARSEDRRDRATAIAPFALRTGAFGLLAAGLLAVFVIGGADPGNQPDIFQLPDQDAEERETSGAARIDPPADGEPTTTTNTPTAAGQSVETTLDGNGPSQTTPEGAVIPDAPANTGATTPPPPTPGATAPATPGTTAPAAPPSTAPTTRPGATTPTSTTPTSAAPPTSQTPPSSAPPVSRPAPP